MTKFAIVIAVCIMKDTQRYQTETMSYLNRIL